MRKVDVSHVSKVSRLFTRFSTAVAHAAGRPITFVICCAIILAWALSGPIFGFSDTWQLIINTSTTIVTFLMVFLIQNTQNRDGAALHAKLDELIRASAAHNRFIGIEHMTNEEIDEVLAEIEARAKEEGRALSDEERAEAAQDVARERGRRKPAVSDRPRPVFSAKR
jgi:low affinity Fe/Cu permease